MKSMPTALIVLAFTCSYLPPVAAQDPARPGGFVNLAPDDVVFEPMPDTPGASQARLLGDPAWEGPYVVRLRVPANHLFRPHSHDQDRHITVIAGTWAFGAGESGSCENTVPMPPGSYVFHPKGAVHFDGSCTNEAIEVQIIGMGPVKTVMLGEE